MMPFAESQSIDIANENGSVVSVLVAEQMNRELLQWIYGSWPQLHEISGYSWHFLVPTNFEPLPDQIPEPETFDWKFSNQLRDAYGLGWRQTPCLVFDNFIEDQKQRYIDLSGSEEERTYLVQFIAEKIRDGFKKHSGEKDLHKRRLKVTEGTIDRVKADQIGRKLLKLAPQGGSALARLMTG